MGSDTTNTREKFKGKKLFSTEEAAEYLGITLATMKYHLHVANNIEGHLVGHSLVFMRDELDHFAKTRRPPGRPRGSKNKKKQKDNPT